MAADDRASASLVWGRAGILGAVVLLVGSVSHVTAGGLLPHPALMALMLAASSVLTARFLLRPASALRLMSLVVVGQGLVHLGLSLAAGHRPASVNGLPDHPHTIGQDTGILHALQHAGAEAAVPADGASPGLTAASHLVDHLMDQGPAMLLGHLLAAAAVGGWLAIGESALWALVVLTAARLGRLVMTGNWASAWSAAALAALAGGLAPVPARDRWGFVAVQHLGHLSEPPRGPPLLLEP